MATVFINLARANNLARVFTGYRSRISTDSVLNARVFVHRPIERARATFSYRRYRSSGKRYRFCARFFGGTFRARVNGATGATNERHLDRYRTFSPNENLFEILRGTSFVARVYCPKRNDGTDNVHVCFRSAGFEFPHVEVYLRNRISRRCFVSTRRCTRRLDNDTVIKQTG